MWRSCKCSEVQLLESEPQILYFFTVLMSTLIMFHFLPQVILGVSLPVLYLFCLVLPGPGVSHADLGRHSHVQRVQSSTVEGERAPLLGLYCAECEV